jgi:hypothetical protein
MKRADVVAELFERNPGSIDGIALAMVSLNALAWYRYTSNAVGDQVKGTANGGDQIRFRRLLTEYCTASFKNRMSIPELVRAIRKDDELKSFEGKILAKFPVIGMSSARQPTEDPALPAFEAWAKEQGLTLPSDFSRYDHAGCIHRHYRNSVIHELRIAKGKDAGYFGEKSHSTPIYYMNYMGRKYLGPKKDDDDDAAIRFMNEDPVEYMRFGIKPMYLLQLLREAIASLREWALKHDRHIFPTEG